MELGTKYYVFLRTYKVIEMEWKNDSFDKKWLEEGRAFLDMREALKMLRIHKEVRRHSYKFKTCTLSSTYIRKWYPCLDDSGNIDIRYAFSCFNSKLFFRKKEDILKAIKSVGEEDFIKYYLKISG